MFYGSGYASFDAVFALAFLLAASVIVVAIIKSVSEWQKNNYHMTTSVTYFVTF